MVDKSAPAKETWRHAFWRRLSLFNVVMSVLLGVFDGLTAQWIGVAVFVFLGYVNFMLWRKDCDEVAGRG